MKKILSIAFALTLTSSLPLTAVSCVNKTDSKKAVINDQNSKKPEDNHINEDINDKKKSKIKKKIESYLKDLRDAELDESFVLSYLDLDKSEDILKKSLIDKLFITTSSKLDLKVVDKTGSSLDENNNLVLGTMKVQLIYDNEVQSLNDKIEFNIKIVQQDQKVFINSITSLQNYNSEIINIGSLKFDDLGLNLGNDLAIIKNMTIANLFSLLIGQSSQIIKTSLLPNKMPQTTKEWEQWDKFVDYIESKGFLKQLLNGKKLSEFTYKFADTMKEQQIYKVFSSSVTVTPSYSIEFNLRDIINTLSFDIIHFNNFLKLRNTEKKDNFLLNFVQYLYDKPQNYLDDGYVDANQKPINKNAHDVNNNLQHLVKSIMKGLDVNGQHFDKGINIKINFKIAKEGLLTKGLDRLVDIDKVINNIKTSVLEKINFIAEDIIVQLGNTFVESVDLTKPLRIKFDSRNWNLDIQLPLLLNFGWLKNLIMSIIHNKIKPLEDKLVLPTNNLIPSLVPILIKTINPAINDKDLNKLNFQVKSGILELEYQNIDNEWQKVKSLSDITNKDAKDLRMRIINAKIKIISNELDRSQVVELKDIILITGISSLNFGI